MLGKRIALYAMGPIGVAALSFAILPLLTWIATPETVAIYSLFTVVLNLTVMASSFGLDQSLVRFYYATIDKTKLLVRTLTPGLLLLASGGIIMSLVSYDLSANTIGLASVNAILCVAIFLAYKSRFLSLVLRMEDKAFHYSFSQLLPKVWLLCALIYFYFMQQQVSGSDIVTLLLAGWVLVVVYQTFHAYRAIGSTNKPCTEKATTKALWAYGLPLLVSSCSYYLLTVSDKFFIKEMIDLESVATYSTSAHFANVIFIVQSVFVSIWPPFIYKLFETTDKQNQVQNIITFTSKIMSLTVVLLWSLTGVASVFVEFLLPSGYEAIRQLMPVLVAVPLLCLLAEVSGIGINLKKKTMYNSLATMTALVVNLLLNYLLIPLYGVGGASIATVLSFFLYFVIKTESAARLGFPVKRLALYSMISTLLLVSIYLVMFDIDRVINGMIWLTILLSVLVVVFVQRNGLKLKIRALQQEVANV